jgi:Mrp family chromosome partitioning ATPase
MIPTEPITSADILSQGLPRSGSIPRMQRGLPERRKIKDVKKVIAVSSAKGGVGKSTIAGLDTDQNYQQTV